MAQTSHLMLSDTDNIMWYNAYMNEQEIRKNDRKRILDKLRKLKEQYVSTLAQDTVEHVILMIKGMNDE